MAKKKDYKQCLRTPYKTGIGNFAAIAEYFQYKVPGIDSAQSSGSIDDEAAAFEEMLKSTSLSNKGRILGRIQDLSWKKDGLDANELDFEDSRFLCNRKSKETELHALLRHIRNSLAHGHLYIWKKKKGDFIFLIDFNTKRNPTAKIMVSKLILDQWKKILERRTVRHAETVMNKTAIENLQSNSASL